ncbi:SDR family NAD(P)-dependent oxidoreductase [Pseudoclavibacter soli]|uniref:SDR family NAD(P)-dependent oxidoreductase n=1 Tax=Pseudoclavibacter soli TaxID=452623 RepID=UPI0009FCBE8F|nr:SDR family NAD(P)-dependent oxidoreductase [Pseudoclavibacter soli]
MSKSSPSTARHAVITGADSGLGRATAGLLAQHGYALTLTARSNDRLQALREELLQAAPDAVIDTISFDLSSINSIKDAAAEYLVRHDDWSLLLNLAEVRGIASRTLTEDGFEWHFGVNHLGHFVWTGLLLTSAAKQASVVSLTSSVWRMASTRFHDLRFDHGYRAGRAFAQSKRAQLLFARELDRRTRDPRVRDYPKRVRSLAFQPEPALGLGAAIPRPLVDRVRSLDVTTQANTLVTALHSEAVPGGSLVSPAVRGQQPQLVEIGRVADEQTEAKRLWRISDQLTRVTW